MNHQHPNSMKKNLCRIAICVLASLSSLALAQDFIGATYDLTPDGTNQAALCGNLWGSAPQTYTLDGSKDANANPASGAEKVVVTMNGQGNDQFVSKFGFAETNSGLFTNVEFDIFWSTSSPQGNWYFGPFYGHLDFGFTTPSSTDIYDSLDIHLADAGNWLHVVRAIQSGETVNGILLKMYCGGYGNPQNGTITYWVDNVKLTGRRPPIKPILGMQKATPGLRIFAGSYVNTYDREQLATVDQNQSWVGGTYPVSYSFTLNSFPTVPDGSVFRFHIFLIPTNSAPPGQGFTGNQYIDYNASNIVWLDVSGLTPANVTAEVQWKTNLTAANPDHTALRITNSTAVGTWTLAFNSANTGTLTAPGASPVAFSIPADAAARFTNKLVAFFGVQPDSGFGMGQYVDVSHIQTIGVKSPGVPVNDNFTTDTVIKTAVWDITDSAAQSSLVLVTTNTPYWVNWTVPDTGFIDVDGLGYLGVTANLTTGPWVVPEYYNSYNDGINIPGTARQNGKKWTLIPSTCLPTVNGQPQSGQALSPNAFFRLYNAPPPAP
jgi:hypothetical protein